jgi:lycopene cyclase domain-containing protein
LLAAAGVVGAELGWFRTGVFKSKTYWISMTIVAGFMVAVDGWMSKLSAPIVIYDPKHLSGVRFPWDIPTEEFLYAFALLTLPILIWERDEQLAAAARP